MLIEFRVSNFRSIREEQVFSLVASNAIKELDDCVIKPQLPGLSKINFLKGAALYGANASGKSNIFFAIRFLANFVKRSATKLQPGDSTGVEPFKLDQKSIEKPSEFEITFVAEGVRYVFGLLVTSKRVIEEYLVAYPKKSPQRWYHRTYDQKNDRYDWVTSTEFKSDKSLQDKTRENSLFLSVAPQFNHPQLTQVFTWFQKYLRFIQLSAEGFLDPAFTVELLMKPLYRERILNLLKSADVGVADAEIQEHEISIDEMKKNIPPDILAKIEERGELKPGKSIEVNLAHIAEKIKPVVLDFQREESAGTRRFFSLLGPWTDLLDKGYTVFIDEIDTSLHPILIKELLKLLFCNKNNQKGAQVIFTTHNSVLLDAELMRRDQIWFTEKTSAGTTHLYPLTDYQPRKSEALAKGYLAGRYGAIPFLPHGLKL